MGIPRLARRTQAITCLFIVSFLALAACETFTADLKPTAPRPEGVVTIPVSVGVYYSPETLDFTHLYEWYGDFGGREVYAFPLGRPRRLVFDDALSMMFREAVPVDRLPTVEDGGPSIAGVVEVGVDAVQVSGLPVITFTSWAEITYKFSLFSADGSKLATWRVTGVAEKTQESLPWGRPHSAIIEAVEFAIQDAAAKFMTHFRDVPEVRRWLQGVT